MKSNTLKQVKKLKKISNYSDLAVEFSRKLVQGKDYVKVVNKQSKFVTTTYIDVTSEQAEKTLERQMGSYVSIDLPFNPVSQNLCEDEVVREIKKGISYVLNKEFENKPNSVLVVGLGNPNMVADCFGSKVVQRIMVTRHAIKSGFKQEKLAEVSKISCNVFGKTGIESFDIISGVVEKIRPDLVILIDTLVAESPKRLCRNIQIASVGIVPGSGVDNARKALNKKTLKTKVITIGVPFVVYAENICAKNGKLKTGSPSNLIVMPREIEGQIKFCANSVASGINQVLNPNLSPEMIETFFD